MLFFKASREETTLYLFGSIGGVFKPDLVYPLPARIHQALASSQLYLYHRISEEDIAHLDQASISQQPWDKLLTPEALRQLTAIVQAMPLQEEQKAILLSYHPWLVMQLLYYNTLTQLGFHAQSEEEYLLNHALEKEIPSKTFQLLPAEIPYLLTTSQRYPNELYQWVFMKLRFLQGGINLAEALQHAWLKGDIDTVLDQLVISRSPDFAFMQEDELLLYEATNQIIWASVDQFLSSTEHDQPTLFLALPAEYLLDSGGFASYLEEMGFQLTQI